MQVEQEDAKDFLILNHGSTGFLIDRETFFASVYLEKSENVIPRNPKTPLPEYLHKTMLYSTEILLVFDLDSYLRTIFGSREQGTMKIALIAAVDSFGEAHAAVFRELAQEIDDRASLLNMAFKVGSQAEIKRIALHDLRLVTPLARLRLFQEGIIGCRFRETAEADFVIDIGSLVFNNLTRTWKGTE